MTHTSTSVSLIVTGGSRPRDLLRFFGSIALQTYCGPVQVVFVDQAAKSLVTDMSFPDTVRLERVSGVGRVSLSAARNIALRHATGAIVAFPDDDCWYAPHLLEHVVAEFNSSPSLDALCTSVFDPERNLAYGRRPPDLDCTITYRNLLRYPISVGIFARRSALDAAGAHFDEALGAGTAIGSGEETELLARMLDRGCFIRYRGALRVFHPVPTYAVEDVAKYYGYGYGFGWLNGVLISRGRLAVCPFLLEVAIRSGGGALVHAFDPIRRKVYQHRLRGIVRGLAEGLANCRPA